MALLARGSVTDRPWGLTFGALGIRGLTGELAVVSDGKTYRVAFTRGAIVAAHSPLASDAAVRVALTGNLITSTQVADITRRMAAAPNRDEIELLAEMARLAPEQAQRLRRRVVANRAARAFSVERGEFSVHDELTLAVHAGSELDIRSVCYLGAKNNFSEERMGDELRALGGWFQLKPDAVEDLPQFGFSDAERPALQMLVGGANLNDLEHNHGSLGARAIRAIIYALVSCGACEIRPATRPAPSVTRAPGQPAQRVGQTASPTLTSRAPTPRAIPSQPDSGAVPTPARDAGSSGIPRPLASPGSSGVPRPAATAIAGDRTQSTTIPHAPHARTPNFTPDMADARSMAPSQAPIDGEPAIRMRSPTGQRPMQTTALPEQRPTRKPSAPPPRRAKRNTAATTEIEQLLASKLPLLDNRVDHFTLLGIAQTANADEVRNTYYMLARKLHPDRLSAIGVVDEARDAQRLMAQINAAFAVLNDPKKRAEYVSILDRGGESAVRAQDAQADEMAMKILRAEEAFRMGEMALRRDQIAQALTAFQTAVELQPNESEYQALLAWAQFAAAPDKAAVANQTRKALLRAAEANDRSPTARFYLGRVERMLGKEREALQHFKEVLRIKPGHADAASEARVLESRLKR